MELRTEKVPKMPPAEPATTKLPQRPAPGSDAAAAAAASAGAAGPSWIPVLGAPPRPDAPAPHGGSDAPPAPAVSTTLAAAAGQVSTKFPVIGAASEPMPVVTGSVVTAAPAPGARTALRIALGAAAIFAAAVAGVWITLLVRGDLDSAGAAGPSARPVRPVHGDSPSDLDEPAASGAADAPGRSGAAAPAPGPAASTAAPAAAPAVAPAPPPATRALTLVVAPAEAEVRVDGTVLPGRSPHRLEGLAPGEALEVELTAPGYEPLSRTVEVTEGLSPTLRLALKKAARPAPSPATSAAPAAGARTYLFFDVSPPGTEIVLDGKRIGVGPFKKKLEVAPGVRIVRLAVPGKPPSELRINALAGKVTNVERKH
jgi:hypothetical protein